MPAALVECATCGTPGRVMFDEKGLIVKAFFTCKCPRVSPEEANKQIEEANKKIE